MTERTGLVALSHVLWSTGRVLPVEELRAQTGIPILVGTTGLDDFADRRIADPLAALDWVNLWALAVNEENAAGGRVGGADS